jgi:acetyl esterase
MTERAYDAELVAMIELLPSIADLGSVENIQASRDSIDLFMTSEPRDDVGREDVEIPGPEGAPPVPVRVYQPVKGGGEARPAVLEIHGGGFITGSMEMADGWCDKVAAELGAVVVSVEYRLAPENPFPAGPEDCYTALSWLHSQAEDLNVATDRVGIAGQSAGGGLAAAVALMARDRGGPELCFQLLEIPELDDRLETHSMIEFDDTPLWNRPNAIWSWRHYLGPDHEGEVSPYAAPARAENLTGLPPAFISAMEFDPLRDEGIIYAMHLMRCAVPTELHVYPGTFHGSALVAGAEVSRRCARDAHDALRRALLK